MTDIEKKALALVNEVTSYDEPWTLDDVRGGVVFKTLCRAIEQHEAFKREVSNAITDCGAERYLGRFILAKPDPLVEVMNEMGFGMSKTASEEFRAALAARGLEIREVQ